MATSQVTGFRDGKSRQTWNKYVIRKKGGSLVVKTGIISTGNVQYGRLPRLAKD